MLSLSLFCSSQTISVALYDRRKLKKFLYKKINNTGIESIFKLIKNCFEGENIKGLSNIFFSNGPGSFTALRTIRSIVEALSLSTNAKVFSVSSFVPLLLSRKDYFPNSIVCLKSLKGKSFFQLYKKKGKVFSKESIVFLDNLKEVEKFYLANAKKIKELSLITNDKKDLEILNKKIKNVFFYPLSAKKIAEVCFLGYGSRNLDIIYHSSYYEKY